MAVVTLNKYSFIELLDEAMDKHANTPRDIDKPNIIHVSNLGYCMRKAVYAIDDKSYKIKDKKSHYRINDGSGWHKHTEEMMEKYFPGRFWREHEITYDVDGYKLIAHPDLIDTEAQRIIEFKTISSTYAIWKDKKAGPEGGYEPQDKHVWQLKSYMSLMGIYDGQVVYRPWGREKGEAERFEFDIHITEAERQAHLKDLFARAKLFGQVRSIGKPQLINVQDVVTTWDNNWQCLDCPYANKEKCPEGLKAKEIREAVTKKRQLKSA